MAIARKAPRAVIVGAGIVGTMHAIEAIRRGYRVTQLEADAVPRRASVRNFGLIWVTGRATGPDLALAIRGRERWVTLRERLPGLPLQACGSLVVAECRPQLAVLEQLASQPGADERGVRLLSRREVAAGFPGLLGHVEGALRGELDAVVEPQQTLAMLHAWLRTHDRYELRLGCVAREVEPDGVRDENGVMHHADLTVLCPGDCVGLAAQLDPTVRQRLLRCRLHMLETAPADYTIDTAVLGGSSLHYYPAFRVPASEQLPPPHPEAARLRAQLIVVQHGTRALRIGDTHEYGDAFDFALDETAFSLFARAAEALLARPVPPVRRRWAGTYAQCSDGSLYLDAQPAPGVILVTGLGGRGMTAAPAVAAETFSRTT